MAGPALQNLLWSILIRTRLKPVVLCGGLQKALRFHWVQKEDPNQTGVLRYARIVFGLVQSLLISEGKIDENLSSSPETYPAVVA